MSAIRFRGHSAHQPSELSARPPALAISLPVTLLGGLSLGGLLLLELALTLLGLGNLPPVVFEHAPIALCDVGPRRRFGADSRSPFGDNPEAVAYSEPYRFWTHSRNSETASITARMATTQPKPSAQVLAPHVR
jgi:hypothetical protein